VNRVFLLVVLAMAGGWLPTRIVAQASSAGSIAERYHAVADSLIGTALSDSTGYHRLEQLVDTYGNRPSGSVPLERAIDWVLAQMKSDGLANVRGERVMVPHWVRGRESAELIQPRALTLHLLGLGGSIGTPAAGITAPVLVVESFDELTRRAPEAKGKIVLFDVPLAVDRPPFDAYDDAVQYRVNGAIAGARVGARAVLIRSIASFSIQSPHTGIMRYDSTAARIPAAALSVEDAELLHRLQKRGDPVVVRLTMGARSLPEAPSRNVVAELPGSERPDEVVVLGGHIDSWDVGQGAMDDGGGAVASWEAVRLMQRLGLRPRRTVRVVLWTSEETGARGGSAYRDQHQAELGKHVLAIESDNGVFAPAGFGLRGSDSAATVAREIAALLQRVGAATIVPVKEGPEADVEPLADRGVPAMGLQVDASRYFWFHHSAGDTFDKIDPGEMARCVAALAVMSYVVADLPVTLPRGP
jgi:carboxypeptidase Q